MTSAVLYVIYKEIVLPFYLNPLKLEYTAGAASPCYQDELMLLNRELMLLKSKINTKNPQTLFQEIDNLK